MDIMVTSLESEMEGDISFEQIKEYFITSSVSLAYAAK